MRILFLRLSLQGISRRPNQINRTSLTLFVFNINCPDWRLERAKKEKQMEKHCELSSNKYEQQSCTLTPSFKRGRLALFMMCIMVIQILSDISQLFHQSNYHRNLCFINFKFLPLCWEKDKFIHWKASLCQYTNHLLYNYFTTSESNTSKFIGNTRK